MNCLRPLIIHWSPFFSARVCIMASGTSYGSQRSDAPRGSVKQCASRNCGSAMILGNQIFFRCSGRILRSSTETFHCCTIFSAIPQSPREISSEITAKVSVSVFGSSAMPPYSSGTPSVRMPIACATSRIFGGKRPSGFMLHSACQFWRVNGMMCSLTNLRVTSRIISVSSDRPLSL